jgi:hypothetical protein
VYQYEGVDVRRKPFRENPPIWIAGIVNAAVEHTARLGDGYFATSTDLDELACRQELANSVREDLGKNLLNLAEWRYTYVSEGWKRVGNSKTEFLAYQASVY